MFKKGPKYGCKFIYWLEAVFEDVLTLKGHFVGHKMDKGVGMRQ